MRYLITAIGTDSGKTLVSAVITKALNADYWKPIQAGQPTDSDAIRNLLGSTTTIHKEAYLLQHPESPHSAAEKENVEISLDDIKLPETDNNLIIETAGGILVPLNSSDVVIDLADHLEAEVILVSNFYLGSINHTLLTIEAIKSRGLSIKCLIFNGDLNQGTVGIITKKMNAPVLLHIKKEKEINNSVVKKYAELLNQRWDELGYKR